MMNAQFKRFEKALKDAASTHFQRVGRTNNWILTTGDITWMYSIEKERGRLLFNDDLCYGHNDWVSPDYSNLHCGAGFPLGLLLDYRNIGLAVDYGGSDVVFRHSILDSFLDSVAMDQILRRHREFLDEELRAADLNCYIKAIADEIRSLDTLDKVSDKVFQARNEPEGSYDEEFWERTRKRMADC